MTQNKKLEPWQIKDILIPCWIRRKDVPFKISTVLQSASDPVTVLFEEWKNKVRVGNLELLSNYEHTTGERDEDGDLIWKPCGIEKIPNKEDKTNWNALVGKKVKFGCTENTFNDQTAIVYGISDKSIALKFENEQKINYDPKQIKLIEIIEPTANNKGLVPWTIENVPFPCAVRHKESSKIEPNSMKTVLATFGNGILILGQEAIGSMPYEMLFEEWEHTTGEKDSNGDLIWKHCGKQSK